MIVTNRLTLSLAVAGQVELSDLPWIAAHYRTLINNRPDGEAPGQPSSAELKAAARNLGLDYVHIPISGEIANADVAAFREALTRNLGSKLAFCRTGNRSARVWALSQSGKRSPKRIIRAAANAGYDLTSLEPELQEAAPPK